MPRKPAETASRKSFDRPTEHKSKRKTETKTRMKKQKHFEEFPRKKSFLCVLNPRIWPLDIKPPKLKCATFVFKELSFAILSKKKCLHCAAIPTPSSTFTFDMALSLY